MKQLLFLFALTLNIASAQDAILFKGHNVIVQMDTVWVPLSNGDSLYGYSICNIRTDTFTPPKIDTIYGVAILIDWAELNLEEPGGYLPNPRLDIVREIGDWTGPNRCEVWRIPVTWDIDPTTYEMTATYGTPEWTPIEYNQIVAVKWRPTD